jgi:eukaryotic-like serine/threonine-protein kinase
MLGKIRFGVYELDRDAMELRKHGVLIRLQDQPFRILAILTGRPGEIITREELQEQIWGKDTFVDFDQSLNKAVNRIREALNDDPARPQYIETVPRRGYRFVAPVTGAVLGEKNTAAPLRADSELAFEKPAPLPRAKSKKIATIAAIAIVIAAALAATVVWFNQPNRHRLSQVRHIASLGFSPTLSRDGKLLAYDSITGGDVPHIWVQQTAGGNAIPVTRGSDPDFLGEFSPDGTRIAFYSTREGGGIYIAPTLPGEPRLVVRVADYVYPRFSPEGDEILYCHDLKAFTVPVDGGQPVSLALNQDFKVDNALWAPSGNDIIFHGIASRGTAETAHWWIAHLPVGEPRLASFPNVEQDDFRSVRSWIRMRDGHQWIVYKSASEPDAWKLFRIRISARRQMEAKPDQLTSGTGHLDSASMSEDGQLVYSIDSQSYHVYEIPINDRGQKAGPTLQLDLPEEGDDLAPSSSRDGRWMVYNSTRPGQVSAIFLRDMQTGTERLLDDKGHRPHATGDAATAISPDGSRVVFERVCEVKGQWFPGTLLPDCSFMVPALGGEPEQLCEMCMPRGFSSDGSVLLIQKLERSTLGKGRDRIFLVDLATKTEKEFLSVSDTDLYHAYFSWNDRWVVFKKLTEWNSSATAPKAQILVAPVRNRLAGKESEWIAVTDGRYSDDKPQFSPDGNTVYFTSTRDGYLCIWAQRLDPVTKHPVGPPVPYEHIHNSLGRDADQGASNLSVARDKILINLPQVRSDIWITRIN